MAMRFNSNGGRVKEMLERIARATQPAVETRRRAGACKKTVRLMVIGIPNVGRVHLHQPPQRFGRGQGLPTAPASPAPSSG